MMNWKGGSNLTKYSFTICNTSFRVSFPGLNLVGTQPGGNLGNWEERDYPDIFPR